MTSFVLFGAAGYVAERHLRAIAETGNRLVAVVDPHDSVGRLDTYFPEARYFRDEASLTQHLDTSGERVDVVSVCSPSDRHLAHCGLGLGLGASVICEKPLVLGVSELDELTRLEAAASGRVFTVLQLRLMPSLLELRQVVAARTTRAQVELECVTRRGPWYHASWKGDPARSGGLAMNIGIHLFDLLLWVFGAVQSEEISESGATRLVGRLVLERADVRFLLSIDGRDLPEDVAERGQSAHRMLLVDGTPLDFTRGFEHLHTATYREVLAGRGVGVADARPALELAERLGRA